MVELIIKNKTGHEYKEVRDSICAALVGCPAFINNDIIVSDAHEEDNVVTICLGDDKNHRMVQIEADATKMGL